jgi:hypothetical protein
VANAAAAWEHLYLRRLLPASALFGGEDGLLLRSKFLPEAVVVLLTDDPALSARIRPALSVQRLIPMTNPSREGPMKKEELPSTLKRSPKKAQRTFIKTHDSAVEQYGEGERAHRTAYASLKHSFEKVGDHWESKNERGPSDPRSKKSTAEKRRGEGETFGGIDYYGSTKQEF